MTVSYIASSGSQSQNLESAKVMNKILQLAMKTCINELRAPQTTKKSAAANTRADRVADESSSLETGQTWRRDDRVLC